MVRIKNRVRVWFRVKCKIQKNTNLYRSIKIVTFPKT
jgi:hypothetical protein